MPGIVAGTPVQFGAESENVAITAIGPPMTAGAFLFMATSIELINSYLVHSGEGATKPHPASARHHLQFGGRKRVIHLTAGNMWRRRPPANP